MAWRKWLVRAVVFSVVGGAAGLAWLFQFWTNPESVRAQVILKLQEMFPGAVVTLDSARLRLLGGIYLNDLRLARKDDPERRDFAHFPRAILYHDKEELSKGRLVLRKIELERPRLRLVRARDGRWNFADLLKPSPGQAVLPTLVIHAGTIILEDRQPSGTPPTVELSDVNLTLLNDPAAVVKVEANGKSDVAARVQVSALWQRQAKDLTLKCSVQGAPINNETLHRFGAYVPPALAEELTIQGLVSGEAELHIPLDGAKPPRYKVGVTLAQGKVSHPKLPLDFVDQLQARVVCEDGRVTVEQATACSGSAKIEASGTTWLPHPEKNFRAALAVDKLAVNEKLLGRLPPSFQKIKELFQPTGPATLRLDFECRDGEFTSEHCFIYPRGMKARFKNFPVWIHDVRGELDYDLLRAALKIGLKAKVAEQPIAVQGTWRGKDEQTDADIHIKGANVPLDEQLLAALPKELLPVANSFHASGLADFDIHVRRQPGQPFANHYRARFHHVALKWDAFKFPLRNVSGILDVYPDRWEFQDFEGSNGRGLVKLRGRAQPVAGATPPLPGTPRPTRFQVAVFGENVALNEELYNAFQGLPQKGLTTVWDTFQPSGRVDFRADIDYLTGDEKRPFAENIDLTIDLRDATAAPRFFRVPFQNVGGRFHYAKNRVEIWNLKAAHKSGSQAELAYGKVDLFPAAGYYAQLKGFRADPLVVDDELLDAMPERVKKALQTVQLKEQPVQVRTDLIISQRAEPGQPPDFYWDGECRFKDTRLDLGMPLENVTGRVACRGRFDGKQFQGVNGNVSWQNAELLKQPFHDVQGHFYVLKQSPDTVLLDLKAPLFGGEVSGQGKVVFGSNLRYDLNLTASQVKMEEFALHNLREQAQWKGLAEARLYVTGRGGAPESLEGKGSLDIRSGKLYNLPFLLDLLKFLGYGPDRTLFQETHAAFSLQGKRVRITRLDLLGNVISFSGRGEINTDGSDVQLDFYPSWGRMDGLLPPLVRDIPPAISKTLFKIEARGRLSNTSEDLQFHKRLIPPLFDPILQLGERWSGAEKSQK